MPILHSNTGQTSPQHILLTSGLGFIFGLFFGLPPALAGMAMGLDWEYGLGAILSGLVIGLLLAFLLVVFLVDEPGREAPSTTTADAETSSSFVDLLPGDAIERRNFEASPTAQRLAGGRVLLENVDAERRKRRDSTFAATVEQRIVWGELLELELQDVDEQIERIKGAPPSFEADKHAGTSGFPERNDS